MATYKYSFHPDTPAEDIEGALVFTIFAVEAIHGECQVRLDATHRFDAEKCTCVIDASTPVGIDFNRFFLQFVRREFGEDSFRVTRLAKSDPGHQRAEV